MADPVADTITGELRDGLVLGAIGMVLAIGGAVAMTTGCPWWLAAVLLVGACDGLGFGVAWLICGLWERDVSRREVPHG